MLSNKPYLIRAFFEWIVDSKCTPFIVINANFPRCKVPQDFIEDGQITLNISPEAIRELKLGNELVEFRASFTGIVHIISAPVKAVLAIYAHENGQGMFFDFEEDEGASESESGWGSSVSADQSTETVSNLENKKKPSHLKLVE